MFRWPKFRKVEDEKRATMPMLIAEEWTIEELRDFAAYQKSGMTPMLTIDQWADRMKLSVPLEVKMQMLGFTRLEKYVYRNLYNKLACAGIEYVDPTEWLDDRRRWCVVDPKDK